MEFNQLKKQVIKNAFFQGITGIISKIGGLIATVLIARLLFPELFGIYSLALTIIITIVTLSDLGIGTAITRYIAESLGKKNKKQAQQEARSRFLFLFKFKLISSLVLSILLFIFAGLIAIFFKKPELALPLRIGSIFLLITSLYGVISPIFLAIQKVKYPAIAEVIFEVLRVALLFIFLYIYKNVAIIFFLSSLALLVALVYSFIVILKKYPFLFKGKIEPVERKRLLFFSGFLTINSLNAVIFTNIDRLVLGYYADATLIGFYAAIFTVVTGALGLINFVSAVFPVFVTLQQEKLKRAFQTTFHYLMIVSLPITLGASFLFLYILRALYGKSYVPVPFHFAIIVSSVLLSLLIIEEVLTTLYVILFNAKEKPKWPALIAVFAAILNTVLVFLFVYYFMKIKPEYGLIGAAAAAVIGRYFNLIMLSILCKKKFNLYPKAESIFKPLIASTIMVLFLFVFTRIVEMNTIWLVVSIILAALVYFIAIIVLKGIKKEDADLFKKSKYFKLKKN